MKENLERQQTWGRKMNEEERLERKKKVTCIAPANARLVAGCPLLPSEE